jgi:hypothetical protein
VEEDVAEEVDTGALLWTSRPEVAQPDVSVQHALNTNQKVADLLEKRI